MFLLPALLWEIEAVQEHHWIRQIRYRQPPNNRASSRPCRRVSQPYYDRPLERCPSGRRSSTGNAVCGLNRIEGSNPSLSAVRDTKPFNERVEGLSC